MSDFQDRYSRSVHLFTVLVAHLNSALNPVLYAVSNPLFRRGYKNFTHRICSCLIKTPIQNSIERSQFDNSTDFKFVTIKSQTTKNL